VTPSHAAAAAAPQPAHPRVLLAGNPNSGKTTLFNQLTGARAKVGNYPGVTVERRVGLAHLGDGLDLEIVDLPGTYSLSAGSPEEQVAIDALLGGEHADAVIVLADATTLARGLYLVLQVIETGAPCVLALNMMDEVEVDGTRIDVQTISERLGVEVVPMVASRGQGLPELGVALRRTLASAESASARALLLVPPLPAGLAADVSRVEAQLGGGDTPRAASARRARALWAMVSLGDDELVGIAPSLRTTVDEVRAASEAAGRNLDLEVIGSRYARIDALVAEAVGRSRARVARSLTDRVDDLLTHRIFGPIAFVLVMAIVFEALFSWSSPAVDFISNRIADLQGLVSGALPDGVLRDLIVQGVIAGVGNVLVFVPQIALLFVFIGLLEDSGYLARVAFVIDRLMARVGLHGKAFVPMLSGYACAIPAVMATRTIESRRDRLLTMLVVPLTSCSARLPVYVLMIGTLFAHRPRVLGVFDFGAVVLFLTYFLSAAGAVGAAAVLRRTMLRGPRPTMVLELPPYRLPVWRNLGLNVWQKVRSFLVQAGSIILALSIVLWALLSFPRDHESAVRFEAARAAATSAEERSALEERQEGEQLRHSVAGRLGHAFEPVIRPLGFDWRIGIGLLGAFAAREVFVSTMGLVFDVGKDDQNTQPLRTALQEARRPDGSKLMTPLVGVSLMIFFVFACQCMSTIAVVRRESGSWRWPIFMFSYMSGLAYVASLLVYQVGRVLGLGGG
jgi:ferrous iron transport protein B